MKNSFPKTNALLEIAALFLKLGTTAFGGPAVHIAMMEEEVVRRKKWLTREKFLDLLGATNLIPGPNSTEMAIHIGFQRAGIPGLITAGLCFILPAVIIVTGLAWGYAAFGDLPKMEGFFYGLKPVMMAVILQALWGLARTALKTRFLFLLSALMLAAALAGLHEVVVIFLGGIISLLRNKIFSAHQESSQKPFLGALAFPVLVPGLASAGGAASASLTTGTLFWVFFKAGSLLFGSGYVLLAFLQADLVHRYHWLTESQLLDAITVGQITPGPVFTTATFVGYLLMGTKGALIATLGIFLPAFVFVAISAPFIPKLRASQNMSAFLDGVNTASLSLMAMVTINLGKPLCADPLSVLILLLSLMAFLKFKIPSPWVLFAAGFLGLCLN